MRGARQLLTLRGPTGPRRGDALRELGIIHDGALLIRDGVIEQAGPSRRLENLAIARGALEINATGRVVMPGFVDSHTHLVYGYPWLDDYEAQRTGKAFGEGAAGFRDTLQLIHDSSAKHLEARARMAINGMVRHGTTTVEAKTGFGIDETGELKILRALAMLGSGPLDIVATCLGAAIIPVRFAGDTNAYVNWMCTEFLPKVQRRQLARFADLFWRPEGLEMEQARRYLEYARHLGFLLKVHAEESPETGIRLAVAAGAVSADHLHAGREEIAILAESDTIATLLPGADFHLGIECYAPARTMIDSGVAVALASNFNPNTSPTYNMQMIIALACARMGMTAAEAISAATINGAHAVGSADRAGSLEPGKYADALILNISDYREIPYHFGINHVHMTLKRGIAVYEEGAVGTVV